MSIPGGIPSLTYVSLTPGSDSLDAEDLIKSDQTLQIHEPGKDKPKTYDNLEGVFDELRVKEEVYSEIFGIGESDEIARLVYR